MAFDVKYSVIRVLSKIARSLAVRLTILTFIGVLTTPAAALD
jgi:hypothetical protein